MLNEKIIRFLSLASVKNRIEYGLYLEKNKKTFPANNTDERNNMDAFNIIEDEFQPDMVNSVFDPKSNIILVTPNDYRYLKRNKFGNIDILTDKKLNISNCEIINHSAVLTFRPKLKILIPRGIKLDCMSSTENNYLSHYFLNYDLFARYGQNEKIPDYYIYTNLRFTLYIDLKRLRSIKNVMTIGFGETLINMSFSPTYFIGCPDVTNVDNVYWVRNDEFMEQFEMTF